MGSILIIEDNQDVSRMLSEFLLEMQCPEASEEVSWFWGKHFLIF